MVRATALILIASAASAAAAEKLADQILRLASRPPATLEPLVRVVSDRMEPTINITSEGVTAIVNKGWLASSTDENSFLRAFVSKKDGAVDAQIYHISHYGERGWRFYTSATYEAPGGKLEQTDLVKIGNDVNCFRSGCLHTEVVGIPIPFDVLERAAAAFDHANPMVGLHYRLFARSGNREDQVLPGNEISAFVAVVRRERERVLAAAKGE